MATLCKHPTLALLGATTLFLTSVAANAAIITVDSIAADWTDVIGGTNVNYVNTDFIAGNEEIRWGNPAELEQSGYRFDGSAPPSFLVNTDMAFSLGNFTHFNFPIYGGGIDSAQLNITADLQIDGNPQAGGPFTFSFMHDETPNDCAPLPVCANDLVSFSNLISSDTFMIGGDLFTLELLGFQQGGSTTSSFSTVEGRANVAQLMAVFRAPTTVPEPGVAFLLGLGLLAMRMTRKRA
jgi:hypothetical protein